MLLTNETESPGDNRQDFAVEVVEASPVPIVDSV
jgi:hypothetical protein